MYEFINSNYISRNKLNGVIITGKIYNIKH
jgi:hypothetical protein